MTPEIDKNNEYSEKSSSENIVSRNVHDKLLSQKRNNEICLRNHIYSKLTVVDESGSKINVIDDSNQVYSIRDYRHELAERYAMGKLSYKSIKELWNSHAPFIVPDDSNPEYSEKSSPEKIVEGYMRGKISMEKYGELIERVLTPPNFYQMAKNKMEFNREQKFKKIKEFGEKLGFWIKNNF